MPFTLPAGQHLDYLWGSFGPSAGPVADGTYYLFRAALWLDMNGIDATGQSIRAIEFPTQTCFGDNLATCEGQSYFSRTVIGVPEPGTYAVLGLGLALMGWRLRRRRPGF
jgi:hypothetical protein